MDTKQAIQNFKDSFLHKEDKSGEPTKPIEAKKEEVKHSEVVNKEPDRSAYNCTLCKGEGLIFEGINPERCPKCNGTGKLN